MVAKKDKYSVKEKIQ